MRPTLPQKFYLAYHLVIGGGQLWTPLLATPTAPEALHGSGQVREAWTDVGKNAVVRRADLRRSDTVSQVLSHLGVDPAFRTPQRPLCILQRGTVHRPHTFALTSLFFHSMALIPCCIP